MRRLKQIVIEADLPSDHTVWTLRPHPRYCNGKRTCRLTIHGVVVVIDYQYAK
jgi:hypothetical protein